MSKTKVGNKENSIINGQWAKHVKDGGRNIHQVNVELKINN